MLRQSHVEQECRPQNQYRYRQVALTWTANCCGSAEACLHTCNTYASSIVFLQSTCQEVLGTAGCEVTAKILDQAIRVISLGDAVCLNEPPVDVD